MQSRISTIGAGSAGSKGVKRLGVFCGASIGKGGIYQDLATELGEYLAYKGIELVYGGASVGIMGVLADAVLRKGGKVWGVIPRFMMEVELAHAHLTQMYIVDSMHERKFKMYELSDAFLALPGGWGTLDELCEILTWAQLNRHQKSCGVFNFNNYFYHLLKQFDHMVEEGLLKQKDLEQLHILDKINQVGEFF